MNLPGLGGLINPSAAPNYSPQLTRGSFAYEPFPLHPHPGFFPGFFPGFSPGFFPIRGFRSSRSSHSCCHGNATFPLPWQRPGCAQVRREQSGDGKIANFPLQKIPIFLKFPPKSGNPRISPALPQKRRIFPKNGPKIPKNPQIPGVVPPSGAGSRR